MKALQFIVPKQLIKYDSAKRKKDIVTIQGKNLLNVTSIEINEQTITEYIKISDNIIIAQLPTFLLQQPIEKLILLGPSLNNTNAVLVNELKDKSVSGTQKLIQRYIKIFLQSPNSNYFNKGGGGVLSMIGQTVIRDGQSIITRLLEATKITKEIIFAEQNVSRLPLNEKLLDVQILNIAMNNVDSVQLDKKIITKAGTESSFNLSL